MNLQESTSLSYKTEFKIDANTGLAYPCFEQPGPGARFSKVLESFRAPKAITKILNLFFFQSCTFHTVFNTNKVIFCAKFTAYTLLSF